MVQPHLIDSILNDLNLNDSSNDRDLPAQTGKVLHKLESSSDYQGNIHYRGIVGKLNYLEKCTRPDIAYAVHQCARFVLNPKEEHVQAVKLIGRYLKKELSVHQSMNR
jgi:hypothetical protein